MSLADAVITAALEAADKHGIRRITRLEVRVGELQQIEREVFEFALKEVLPAAEPRVASTVFDVTTESARLRCRPCGREFGLSETSGPRGEDESEAIHFIPELAHAFLRCPGCSSPDFEVIGGRGVTLGVLEGE